MAEKREDFQKFLDTNQYSKRGILRYEQIFGRFFVSTGGLGTSERFYKSLDIQPGQKVLDVGCGIGGSSFHMAAQYGVDVFGVDLSSNMIDIANENWASQGAGVRHRVHFHLGDVTEDAFWPDSFYDVVVCRDMILHISDKLALFGNFRKTLKPGGKVLITDYCRGLEGVASLEFEEYIRSRGYHLLNVRQYGEVLQKAGFGGVEAVDISDQFEDALRDELKRYKSIKEEVVKQFSEEDFNWIVRGWEDKIKRASSGDQAWGLFTARKLFA